MGSQETACTFRVAEQPDSISIVLAGSVNEESVLEPPDPRGRRVLIDAQGVQQINSMGVRAWMGMMDRLSAGASEVVVVRLPPVLVTQASMISNFLGRARIESFLSPWFCPSCEHTLEQLHGFTDALPESITCPKCSAAMELDWAPEQYLAFRQA
jgi:anti-anti-sigma regulatory factor